jgi:hypothetical protein
MAQLGSPPKTGWAKLVTELLVSDIAASLAFWRDRLGFEIAYQRPERAFAYLERPEGAQIMLCQRGVQPVKSVCLGRDQAASPDGKACPRVAFKRLVPQPLEVLEPIVKYEFIRMPDRSTDLGDDLVVGRVPGRAANPKRPRKPRN